MKPQSLLNLAFIKLQKYVLQLPKLLIVPNFDSSFLEPKFVADAIFMYTMCNFVNVCIVSYLTHVYTCTSLDQGTTVFSHLYYGRKITFDDNQLL